MSRSSDLSIRRLVPADATAYRALRLRGLREHPEAFTSSYEEDSAKPLTATVARLAGGDDSVLWGAFSDGVLAGAIGLVRETRRKVRHRADIVGMYVAPEFARRGVARALLDHAIDHARSVGIEQLTLTVTQGNVAARALYATAGFESFGLEPRAIRVDGRWLAKEHLALGLTID